MPDWHQRKERLEMVGID